MDPVWQYPFEISIREFVIYDWSVTGGLEIDPVFYRPSLDFLTESIDLITTTFVTDWSASDGEILHQSFYDGPVFAMAYGANFFKGGVPPDDRLGVPEPLSGWLMILAIWPFAFARRLQTRTLSSSSACKSAA